MCTFYIYSWIKIWEFFHVFSDSFKAGRSVETTSATARSANNKSALSKSTGKNGDMNAMGPGASSGPAIQTLAGAKLLTGPFTINPAFGVVLPKAQQVTLDSLLYIEQL